MTMNKCDDYLKRKKNLKIKSRYRFFYNIFWHFIGYCTVVVVVRTFDLLYCRRRWGGRRGSSRRHGGIQSMALLVRPLVRMLILSALIVGHRMHWIGRLWLRQRSRFGFHTHRACSVVRWLGFVVHCCRVCVLFSTVMIVFGVWLLLVVMKFAV